MASSLTMPMLSAAPTRGATTLKPLSVATHTRTRMPKRPARVAMCNDSTGHQALKALDRRLKTMRLGSTPTRPSRPVQLVTIGTTTKGDVEATPVATATGASTTTVRSGMTPRRPRFMKPLIARDNVPSVPTSAPTPTRPAMPNPGFASPRRPVSASMATRRRAPSILKRRRTRSATTRRTSTSARQEYVPDGMIVSLPPLLPTHRLLKDAYTQGYDCGVTDSDIESMVGDEEVDDEDMALSGSLGGSNPSTSRPSVAVPSNFVQDMLASLDDSLEEGGFKGLLDSARMAQADLMDVGSPHIPEEMPLNDSPTLILDALTPAGWHHAPRSPTGFGSTSGGNLPSLDLGLDTSLSFGDFDMVTASPAPVPATSL